MQELNPQTRRDEVLSLVSRKKGKISGQKITNGRTKEAHVIDKFSIQCRQLHVMSREFA
jgi:hypothetical protein